MNRNLTTKAYSWLLYFTCFSLPLFAPHWHGKVIAALGVVWVLQVKWSTVIPKLRNRPFFILVLGFIVLCAIGLTYSDNVGYGTSIIESLIPLVVLPMIIFTSDALDDTAVVRNSIVAFVAGVMTLSLASLFFISRNLWDPVHLQSNLVLANERIVQIHPAFLSLYISLCLFFLVDYYFPLRSADRSKMGWLLFGVVVLTGYLVWLNSRAGIFSFICAAVFFLAYRYQGRFRTMGLVFLAAVVVLICVLPFSKKRFIESPLKVLNNEVVDHSDPDVFPLTNRQEITRCSFSLLKGKEIVYGYGTGDGRDVLKNCYTERGLTELAAKGLDSHNEFVAETHRHGLIGLAVLIAIFGYMFIYAIRTKSALLAAFTVLLATISLFENILSAQKGTTFIGLIAPLLFVYSEQIFARHKHNSAV